MKRPDQSEFMKLSNPAKVPGTMDCIKGDKNPAKRADVRAKLSQFNVSKRPEIKEKRRQHMLENNPASRDDVRIKIKQSAQNRIRVTCPHCSKTATPALFTRWHGSNCKNKNGE
jgi:hypothetical protein